MRIAGTVHDGRVFSSAVEHLPKQEVIGSNPIRLTNQNNIAMIQIEKILNDEKNSWRFNKDGTPEHSLSDSESDYTVDDLINALSKLDKSKKIVINTTEWVGDTIRIIEDVDGKYVLYPYKHI